MDRKSNALLDSKRKRTFMEKIMQKIPFYKRKPQSKGSIFSLKVTRYKGHQGDREKARRVRQIEQGIISKDQLYMRG